MPNSQPRQKAEPKSGLLKIEQKNRFFCGYTKSLCILVLAPGVLFLLHYFSQRFLPQISPIFPISPKSESVSSIQKALVTSRPCQSLRSAVVTIYAESEVGSGSIIDLKQYAHVDSISSFVITNNHVVLPAKDGQVNVAIESKSFFTGQVIATDPINDLAIVQLGGQDPLRKVISLADKTNKPQAGQAVCTVGNPFNRQGIITNGKVLGDRSDNDLKLDLYINPGNSGGPLVNANGEVVGVIKSALYLPSGRNSGISFATNLATVDRFIQQNISRIVLLSQTSSSPIQPESSIEKPINLNLDTPSPSAQETNLELSPSSEFWYGMDVNEDLTVLLVDPDSPAEKAGLTGGDRIISVDGKPVKDLGTLQKLLSQRPTSTEFTIERYQEHQHHTILVNKIN